ncbi:MAG: hypothetical protein MI924_03450, partial [Chloroflexales bacterium]|nr:hypothetical protein [Chloroflexales bacterium]
MPAQIGDALCIEEAFQHNARGQEKLGGGAPLLRGMPLPAMSVVDVRMVCGLLGDHHFSATAILFQRDDPELRGVRIAFEARLDLLIADMAERTNGEADRTAIVGCEVVATRGMLNRLHPAVAAVLGLGVDRVDRTLADALLAHRAEVAHPQMLVLLA